MTHAEKDRGTSEPLGFIEVSTLLNIIEASIEEDREEYLKLDHDDYRRLGYHNIAAMQHGIARKLAALLIDLRPAAAAPASRGES